jgi:hypothetical protein
MIRSWRCCGLILWSVSAGSGAMPRRELAALGAIDGRASRQTGRYPTVGSLPAQRSRSLNMPIRITRRVPSSSIRGSQRPNTGQVIFRSSSTGPAGTGRIVLEKGPRAERHPTSWKRTPCPRRESPRPFGEDVSIRMPRPYAFFGGVWGGGGGGFLTGTLGRDPRSSEGLVGGFGFGV